MGEGESMGPLTPAMTRALIAQQEDGRHYPVTWTTLGGYLDRSEEHTSELQSLMRISYAVFCLKKKKKTQPVPKAPNTELNLETHTSHQHRDIIKTSYKT